MTEEKNIEIEEGQPCPMCFTKNLTLRQVERDLPYVGLTYVFSMECQNCDYAMSDVEFENKQKPSKLSFEIGSEEDLKVRIVKSTQAALKIPRIIEEKPGPGGQGYISNIEGVLEKVKKILEGQRDGAQEKSDRK
ncbi:ZPR1 zinc finger domain-containing protein, partial [archaeon]|nr:ZPR1 zinc finger domain-containing protein [archaeon]